MARQACIQPACRLYLERSEGHKVVASTSGKGIYALGTITGDYEFDKRLEYQHSRKVNWETTFWDLVGIDCLHLRRDVYNKFHGRNSQTIRSLQKDEWDCLCEKLSE